MLGYFMRLLFPAALVFGFHFDHFPPPSYVGGVAEVKKKRSRRLGPSPLHPEVVPRCLIYLPT